MTDHLPKPKSGRFTVEAVAGGFVVVSSFGDRASQVFAHKSRARELRDRLQTAADRKAKRGERPCLCCGQSFLSEGPHNRMCSSCRLRGDDTMSFSFINPRRRTG